MFRKRTTPRVPSPALVLANAGLAVVGALVNTATLHNVAGLTDRTVGNAAAVLVPFAGFGVLAYASRRDAPAAVATLVTASLAVGLAVYWFTEPFDEFSGLFGLLVIPAQTILWLAPAIRLLWRSPRSPTP